jgi:hypothetical protein
LRGTKQSMLCYPNLQEILSDFFILSKDFSTFLYYVLIIILSRKTWKWEMEDIIFLCTE